MQEKHWRELVELVGVISIVAALLLLAWEVHQTNRLATASYKAELHASFDSTSSTRLSNPDVARLYPKLEAPGGHLITATETSQIKALANGVMHRLEAVQSAFDQGLISRAEFDAYKRRFAAQLDHWPGLVPHLLTSYDTNRDYANKEVYSPLDEYRQAAARDTKVPD